MKVKDLIEFLQDCDEDADVLLGIQPGWPFEHRVRGVVLRSDFQDCEEEEGSEDSSLEEYSFVTKGRPNDVVLVEGGQIRYGHRDMFDAC